MRDAPSSAGPSAAARIAAGSAAVSVALAVSLVVVHFAFRSQLALAQAADSVSDVLMGLTLLFAVRVAASPADDDHPAGHQRAEPIGALLAAVMAGVLAVEVLGGALDAITSGAQPILAWPLLGAFVAKIVGKGVVALVAARSSRQLANPAVRALQIDARNDVLVGVLAVAGFFGARYGWPGLDAWLAVPVALYVGWGGVELARENVRLLMGAAVDDERQLALEGVVRSVEGVRSAHRLRAVFHGTEVDVRVDIVVDPELTLRVAHDIGHAVEGRLLAEPDVCHAEVHLDVEPNGGGGMPPD